MIPTLGASSVSGDYAMDHGSNIMLGRDRMKRTGPFNYELQVGETTRDQLQFCDRKITGADVQSASPIGRAKLHGRAKLQGRSDECKIERQKNGKVREREEEEGRQVFLCRRALDDQSVF